MNDVILDFLVERICLEESLFNNIDIISELSDLYGLDIEELKNLVNIRYRKLKLEKLNNNHGN